MRYRKMSICAARKKNSGDQPASNHCGVDVCVDEDILKKAPHCPHGPTLLFERFSPGQPTPQRYYACSACRDRKDCGFFQLYTDAEIISDTKQLMREEYNRSLQPWKSQEDFYKRFQETEKQKESERTFCYDCQLLLLPDEVPGHQRHRLKAGIPDSDLARPSYLMEAIENNKTNAQYLFSTKAVKFLVQTLRSMGFSRVLCVGVPRLHEHILANKSAGLDSLLLDIDHRFGQFYPREQFCRYNMFNHFFLDGEASQERCREFLGRSDGGGVVMVTDPPFGGMVDALACGVRWMMELWRSNSQATNQELPVMWIFPYFLEHRIIDSLPNFRMLDYKVDYDNHPLFRGGPDSKKKGSPVRIFTNLDVSKIVLPSSDGYRFCKECQRYVSAENLHCTRCNMCPSKNGTTYRHCEDCQKCVKPSFSHCTTCKMCELPTHDCSRTQSGCHLCGAANHKRRDCPKRSMAVKRPHSETGKSDSSKVKTWPKRRKKAAPLQLHRFRPVQDEDAVGTPQASDAESRLTAQSPESTMDLLPSESMIDNSVAVFDSEIDSTLPVNITTSTLLDATTFSSSSGNISVLPGSKAERRPPVFNIEQSPISAETTLTSEKEKKRGKSVKGMVKNIPQKLQKSSLVSKNMKLMQKIERMRMKRKVKLQL